MKAKKSLGQNFLNSKSALEAIIAASNPSTEKITLEVGPGKGVLTEGLLNKSSRVVAIEKDDRLIPFLKEKFKKEIETEKLILIHKDILDLDLGELNVIDKNYSVVANIPYYITGQILRKFLESENQPSQMTLLIQKEVADRIVAKDGKESLLSLSVKIFGEPKYIKTVPRGAFTPQPKVDSAIITIENILRKKLENVPAELFFKVIHLGFAHKRKQLLPNLVIEYPREKIVQIFEKLGIDLKARAEDIELETWINICKKLI